MGLVFAFMVTIAIHLQLVESLDSDSFINTSQKFINKCSCARLWFQFQRESLRIEIRIIRVKPRKDCKF